MSSYLINIGANTKKVLTLICERYNLWKGVPMVFCALLILICSPVLAVTPQSETPDFPGRIELFLPHVIFAVPDIETNIYFDNLCLVVNSAN